MNVFISYAREDLAAAKRIAARVRADEHETLLDWELTPGENILDRIGELIRLADVMIIVLSENAFRSQWIRQEMSAIALREISESTQRIIVVRLDEVLVPSSFMNRIVIDFSKDFDAGLQRLSATLQDFRPTVVTSFKPRIAASNEEMLRSLRGALRDGRLTLICGAGVSIGAGVPGWSDLLARLLNRMMERISKEHEIDAGAISGEDLTTRGSSLILGKYLKKNLGEDFAAEVRAALYEREPTSADVIEAIAELARPPRFGSPLDSIVTFNFDCLLEERLTAHRIRNKPIFSEAVRHSSDELPIYHVHGYLPRGGPVPEETELVFSEDAYHDQFIDPFSWSNLIQLNKLTQNTCLFIGISLTDPNMRRLLDVAWRKNPDRTMGHYIVKRLPRSEKTPTLENVLRLLEEQDANALGLQVIWTEEFDELPQVLYSIGR
jgi:TIR domain/SIR2-like domain